MLGQPQRPQGRLELSPNQVFQPIQPQGVRDAYSLGCFFFVGLGLIFHEGFEKTKHIRKYLKAKLVDHSFKTWEASII